MQKDNFAATKAEDLLHGTCDPKINDNKFCRLNDAPKPLVPRPTLLMILSFWIILSVTIVLIDVSSISSELNIAEKLYKAFKESRSAAIFPENKGDRTQQHLGLRHDKIAGRKLVPLASFKDPKTVMNKENQQQPNFQVYTAGTQTNGVITSKYPQSQQLLAPSTLSASLGIEDEGTTSKQSIELSGYADLWDPLLEDDIPVFWHIAKAGGSTIKDIMGSCHRFIMATEAGSFEGHANDKILAVVNIGGNPANGIEPSKFVNVDTMHVPGIEKAKRLGLAQSGLADVIVIRHLFEAEEIFNSQHRGRLFAIFRHPIDRAISMYNYLKHANWEPTYSPKLTQMSLMEYAESNRAEYNWLTRALSGAKFRNVTETHLQAAMDVVRRKFLVGLLTKKDETMERIEKFFEWKYKVNPKNQEICRENLLANGANANTQKGEQALPGTPAYDALYSLNELDIRLFKYIETLFEEQAYLFQTKKDGYRLDGATCCKCTDPPECPSPSMIIPVLQLQSTTLHKDSIDELEVKGVQQISVTSAPIHGKDLSRYVDSWEPLADSDVPVFWHIPKAGGSLLKNIMGACYRLVLASAAGIKEGHASDTELAIVKIGGDPANGIEPSKFVNIDTTHLPGLKKAKSLGLVESRLADVIVIRHLFEAEEMFNMQQRGRVFAIFRHPVDRSVSMYNYITFADWEPTYNAEIASMTLEEYVKSPFMEQDWLTRYLSNTMTGPLSEENFESAKEALRRKVIVGLLEKKEATLERFEKFFGWKYKARPKVQEECRVEYLGGGVNMNPNAKEKPQPGTPLHDLISHMNKFDIRLYSYIEQLFDEQAKFTAGIPDGFRFVGATCCECDKTC